MPAAVPLLGTIALNLAFGAAATGLELLLKPKSAISTAQTTSRGISFELTVGESVPVSAIFGRARTGGFLIFAQEYGDNNEFAKFVFVNGKGRYDGLDAFMADEKLRTLSGSNDDVDGRVVDDYTVDTVPHLWIKTYDGRPGQVADPGLIAAAPTRWTDAHVATGTPYSIITIRQDPDLFGSVLPTFGFIWRGLCLYDWRYDSTMPGGDGAQRWDDPSTWAFSKNPYVIKWNFRRGIWINGVRVLGMGFSRYANDLAYYTAAANLADEAVYFSETDTTLPRYEFGREITDDEDRLDVLTELDQAGSGSSFDRGGADAPLPGQQLVATVTLEDKHRVTGRQVSKDFYGTVSQKKTAYSGTFVSEADGWTSTAYPIRISTDLETAIGGRKSTPLDQPYESTTERAQMRAEIELRKNLFPAARTETFGPRSNVLEVGDPITRVMDDWGTMLGQITEITPNAGRTENVITWRQWDNSIIPTGAGFLTLPVGPGTPPVAADRTIVVSGFAIAAISRVSGGAVLPFLKASWTHIADPNVDQVMIRYWPSDGTEAADGESVFASARLQDSKVWGGLQPDQEYTGYAIPIRKDGRTTVKTSSFTVTTDSMSTPAALSDDDAAIQKWLSVSVRELTAALQLASAMAADQDAGNYADKLYVLDQQRIGDANVNAAYVKAILLALGNDGSSIADAIEAVSAGAGDVQAGALVRFTTEASPGGGWSRWGVQVRVAVGDDWPTTASFFLEVNTDGSSRIVLMAEETNIEDAAGNVLALFKAGGVYLNMARIENASITSALIANAAITTAQIGDLQVERIKIDSAAVTDLVSATGTTSFSKSTSFQTVESIAVPGASTYPITIGAYTDFTPPASGNSFNVFVQLIATASGFSNVLDSATFVNPTIGTRLTKALKGTLPPLPSGTYMISLQVAFQDTNTGTVTNNYSSLAAAIPAK